jgi:WD40 repeat protein
VQVAEGGNYTIDARGGMGVQVGERNTQIIYTYNRLTWTDGMAPPPLVSVSGMIDSPYRGLSAFEEQDAAFFFGREAATAEVLKRMSRCLQGMGLLVVSGVSGAGKSSLLRAGVLPRIRGAGLADARGSASWPCLVFTPTHTPLDELALRVASLAGADAAAVRLGLDARPEGFALTARQAALTRPLEPAENLEGPVAERHQPPQRRLLLVVDQFEQVFTQCSDDEERQRFITALHAAATTTQGPSQAPSALVVLGVRADFEARCADYLQLADAIQDRYLVTAMTERQLRMAITEPAKRAGSQVDDDLVEVLLAEVHTRQPGVSGAGVLPLLSHALDQAWRCRTGEAVTLADYERTGGIERAVADSAQRAYDQLTRDQQAAARQIFLRLTATSSDGVDTTDRAARAELTEGKSQAGAQDVEAVLEAFAAERLLTLAADSVEVSHEVLLTAWPLLRDTWLTETHADRIVRTRLHNAAAEWNRHSRDKSYLYGGSLLQEATKAAARTGADPARHPQLSQSERDFLQASKRAHRRNTRLRGAFIASLIVLVVGLVLGRVLIRNANQQAAYQSNLRNIAVSDALDSQSQVLTKTNPAISKLLSIAAWDIRPTAAARYAMLGAAGRPPLKVLSIGGSLASTMAFSPHSNILAIGDDGGGVEFWDPVTGHSTGSMGSAGSGVLSIAFSPDGTTVATGGKGVLVTDAANGQWIGEIPSHSVGVVHSVEFSPDGKILATLSIDGSVRLWNLASRPQFRTPVLVPPGDGAQSMAFSPDGKILATGYADGTVRLWNPATGQSIGALAFAAPGGVYSVAFSPNGKILATGNGDGTVRLWNSATDQPIGTPLTGLAGRATSLAFSPDDSTLATGSRDGTVRLWDVATQVQIGPPLLSHAGFVTSVAFSSDGTTLAILSLDGKVRLLRVSYIGDIVRHLCVAAGRSLTRAEWRQYVPPGQAYQKVCP